MAQAGRKRKRREKTGSRRASGSSWGMLVIGLVSGSVLAALILGAQEGNRYGFGSGLKTLFRAAPRPVETNGGRPAADAPQAPKPKLDFYTVLPKIERVISDPVPTPQEKPRPDNQDALYVLQVAAYERFTDADRLKAQLTITGYDAAIQKVTVDDKTYYRVRLGPYKSRRELKNVEQKLADQGIRGMALRVTAP